MEDVPLETKRGISFEHDGAPPHFGRQDTDYLNQRYENRWIGRGPVPWPPRSPDLSPLDFLLRGPVKVMTYRAKLHTREEQLHLVVDAAAYIRERPEMIQRQ
jgi:hypothetical protein